MKLGLILIAALLLAACQQAPKIRKLAIVGAKLIDGTGGTPIDHSIVLIEGATFIKIGPQTSVPLPKDVEIVDGMGKTIEPSAPGATLAAGQPANLKLVSTEAQRTMKDGQWQN